MSERKQDGFRSVQEELAALGLYFPGVESRPEPIQKDAIQEDAAPAAENQLHEQQIQQQPVQPVETVEPVEQYALPEPQKVEPTDLQPASLVPIPESTSETESVRSLADAGEPVQIVQAEVIVDPPISETNPENVHEAAEEAPLEAGAAEEMNLQDRAMSMVEHLGDLRKRLIYSVVAFVIFLILSLFFVEKIFRFLTKPLGTKLTVLGPAEIIHIYFMIGGFVAIVPTIPFVMWQLWLFIAPGLKPKERKVTLTYIPAVLLAFVFGIYFGYEFVFPKLMIVLGRLSTQNTDFMPTADAYFSFMTKLILPFGFIFEMPLIVMFLTRLGIINPYRLNKFRKYAYFFIVLISFMLTPPEITTHLSLTIPMLLLYEFSIQISKYAFKRRLLAQEEAAKKGE